MSYNLNNALLDHISNARKIIFEMTGEVDLSDLEEANGKIDKLEAIGKKMNEVESIIKEFNNASTH